jgi:hypothetical protein
MAEQEPPGDENPNSRRAVLIGFIIVLLLVCGGLYLISALRNMSHLQDCVMQGRSNCSPIDAPAAGH